MRRYKLMNETIQLTTRQKAIVNIIASNSGMRRGEIALRLPTELIVSKAAMGRDLKFLVKEKAIRAIGKGPSTVYASSQAHPLLAYVDLKQYFAEEPDFRKASKRTFDDDVFSDLAGILSEKELQELHTIYRPFSRSTKVLNPTIMTRELERYLIEFSWKSSKIEGNTYTLLETENLIKQGERAPGRTNEESQMILNHKDVFKVILNNPRDFRMLSVSRMIEVHSALTRGLGIVSGIRKQSVGITGTNYRPPDNEWQVRDALDQAINAINELRHPLERALVTMALIAYIQPFADGNKRTARILANAILLAYDFFPLSYRSVDEKEYKEALIVFFETANLYHVKRLFLEQYRFALKTYFVS